MNIAYEMFILKMERMATGYIQNINLHGLYNKKNINKPNVFLC